MTEAWTRIEAWIEHHAPGVALSPPAAPEQLAACGVPLTAGLEALYGRHDGQLRGELFDRHRFLPLEEALRLRGALLEAEGLTWDPAWLPIGARLTGELLALDLESDTVRRYGPHQPAKITREFGWGVFSWRGFSEAEAADVGLFYDTVRDQIVRVDYARDGSNSTRDRVLEWGVGSSPQAMLEGLAADLEAGRIVWDDAHGLLHTLWLDALEDAYCDSYEKDPLKRLRKLYQGTPKALRQLRDMAKRHVDPGAGHHLGVALAALGKLEEAIAALEAWTREHPGSEVHYTRDGVTTVTRIPRVEEPLVRALLADLRSRGVAAR